VSRSFLAAILKKALEVVVPLQHVDAEIERRVAEKAARGMEDLVHKFKRDFDPTSLKDENEKMKAAAEAFHKETGEWLSATDAKQYARIGRAIKLIRYSGLADWLDRGHKALTTAASDIAELRKALPPEVTE
jgi:restriction endonuclease Mrr